MNAQAGSSWLRFGLQCSALAAAGSVGFVLAARPPVAAADGLLPTTITVPSLPISVPTVSLPTLTTTTGTTTTTPTTTASTPSPTTGSTAIGTPAAPAAGAGASAADG